MNLLKDDFITPIWKILFNSNKILKSGKILQASPVSWIKILFQRCNKTNKLTIKGFLKISLCKGLTKSPLDIHESSLCILDLTWVGTTSLDSYSTQKLDFIENKRRYKPNKIWLHIKKKNDAKDSKWFFEMDIWQK